MSTQGKDDIANNINNTIDKTMSAAKQGMDYALRDTVNHIKAEFIWSKNGKGFNDRTGILRKSISHKVSSEHDIIMGWVYSAVEYAPYVEFKWEGKHAYMYPGVKEKRDDIVKTIASLIKGVMR